MRLAAQSKGGFYPTPPRVVDLIAGLIRVPGGYYHRNRETLRILDPCCGPGRRRRSLPSAWAGPTAAHRDLRRGASQGQGGGGGEAARPRAGGGPVPDLHRKRGLRPRLRQPPPMIGTGKTSGWSTPFLTSCTRYLAEGGLLVFIVPRHRLTVSARYLATHYGRMRCWAFPDPERQVFDQIVLCGYRKADPSYDASAEEQLREWAEGDPEELYPHRYPPYSPPVAPMGTSCSPPAPWTRRLLPPRRGGRGCGPARR